MCGWCNHLWRFCRCSTVTNKNVVHSYGSRGATKGMWMRMRTRTTRMMRIVTTTKTVAVRRERLERKEKEEKKTASNNRPTWMDFGTVGVYDEYYSVRHWVEWESGFRLAGGDTSTKRLFVSIVEIGESIEYWMSWTMSGNPTMTSETQHMGTPPTSAWGF